MQEPAMDTYSPDFAPYWGAPNEAGDDRHLERDDRRSAGDEQALAELAERVMAARSIV